MDIKALVAEGLGSFALVAVICGTALFAAPAAGIVAIALGAGLIVAAMMVALGPVSGGHFNPLVTIGLVAGGRVEASTAVPYIAAHLVGAVLAAAMFWVILAGAPVATGLRWNTFVTIANMHGDARQFPLMAVFLAEGIGAMLLIIVIMGATSQSAPAMVAPLAIGFAYVVLHLVLIPISNAGLNPARASATALFAGPTALAQLWVYWVAPLVGGVIGGLVGRWLEE